MDSLNYNNIVKCIKKSLHIDFSSTGSIFVFALAINRDNTKNHVQTIKFNSGTNIGSGVYDAYNDCFYVKCEDYIFLDSVPIVITCTVEDNSNWSCKVPISKKLLNKFMDSNQKKIFKKFTKQYPNDKYKIEFMQLYNSRCK